jgi:ABC-2 type transport system ATP-binding protein
MSDARISIRGLTKSFPAGDLLSAIKPHRNGADVLRGVNLEVLSGQVFGLLGPNGAGKTTLLEILATLLLPKGGTAQVCGFDVAREPSAVRLRVGYCPAAADSFYPRLSSKENLQFFAALHELAADRSRERVQQVLDLMQLNGSSGVAFQKLSQGMKQRLGLARALLADAPVLLLDEPFRSLDPIHQSETRRLLRGLAEKGKAILLVTHNLAEAQGVCDRIGILHKGRLIREGPAQEFSGTLPGADLTAIFEAALEEVE